MLPWWREERVTVERTGAERALTAAEIERLLGPGSAVELGVPGQVRGALHPEEAEAVARAVAKRRDEFEAGRVLARRALARLSPELAAAPLPVGPDRAPAWPAGFVGTITHSRHLCAAAAARAADAASLGLDLEPATPLKEDLVARILGREERAWLAARPPGDRLLLAKLVFSAKEAFYKCQHPLTGRFLEFHDVCLALDLDAGAFTATVAPDKCALPPGVRVSGRFLLAGDHVVAAARAERAPSPAPETRTP